MDDEDLIRAAWREWQECASFHGAFVFYAGRPPRWFIEEELGFSVGGAPSLGETCRGLAATNRAHLRALAPEDRPARVTYPRRVEATPARPRRAPPKRTIDEVIATLRARLGLDDDDASAPPPPSGDDGEFTPDETLNLLESLASRKPALSSGYSDNA